MVRKSKHELKREQLIEKVKSLSEDCDLAEITMRDLCERLNFTTGSFYHYFKDKNEILSCILGTVDDHLITVEQQSFGDSQRDNILLVVREYANYNASSGASLILQLNGRGMAGKGDIFLHRQRPIFQILQRCFAVGVQAGEFATAMPPQELAQMTLVVMRGYALDWAKYNGSYDLAEQMSKCVLMLLKGL